MTGELELREKVVEIIRRADENDQLNYYSVTDAILSLFSPIVEGLTKERDELRRIIESRDHEQTTGSVMSGWRPIETAPKDGNWILAAYADTGHMLVVAWDAGAASAGGWVDGATDNDGDLQTYPVTHWMPPRGSAPQWTSDQ